MIGTCCLIFIIILLPPLGVFFMRGCTADFWINLVLTILGYLPGHLHAFYLLVKMREQKRAFPDRAQPYTGKAQVYNNGPPPYGAVPPS
ncbi:unnamed protein product [Rhizopus stolonifer]